MRGSPGWPPPHWSHTSATYNNACVATGGQQAAPWGQPRPARLQVRETTILMHRAARLARWRRPRSAGAKCDGLWPRIETGVSGAWPVRPAPRRLDAGMIGCVITRSGACLGRCPLRRLFLLCLRRHRFHSVRGDPVEVWKPTP